MKRSAMMAAGSLLALAVAVLTAGCQGRSSPAAVPLPMGGDLTGAVLSVDPHTQHLSIHADNGSTYLVNASHARVLADGTPTDFSQLHDGERVRVLALAIDQRTLEIAAREVDTSGPDGATSAASGDSTALSSTDSKESSQHPHPSPARHTRHENVAVATATQASESESQTTPLLTPPGTSQDDGELAGPTESADPTESAEPTTAPAPSATQNDSPPEHRYYAHTRRSDPSTRPQLSQAPEQSRSRPHPEPGDGAQGDGSAPNSQPGQDAQRGPDAQPLPHQFPRERHWRHSHSADPGPPDEPGASGPGEDAGPPADQLPAEARRLEREQRRGQDDSSPAEASRLEHAYRQMGRQHRDTAGSSDQDDSPDGGDGSGGDDTGDGGP